MPCYQICDTHLQLNNKKKEHAQNLQLLVSTEGIESLCKTDVSCMFKTTFRKMASLPRVQNV